MSRQPLTLVDLPCRWRGAETPPGHGRYQCYSTKLIVHPDGVSLATCAKCYCRDHDKVVRTAGDPPPVPSLGRQIMTAAQAYTRWLAAGMPRPTEEELAERVAACEACPHLKTVSGEKRCGLCGCPINKVSHLFGTIERPGKAEMSTEQCSADPPRWKSLTVVPGE